MAKIILENNSSSYINANPRFWLHCLLDNIEIFYTQENISKDTYWASKTFLYLGYGYYYYKEEHFNEIYLRKNDTIFYISDLYYLKTNQNFIEFFIKNKELIENYSCFAITNIPDEHIYIGSFTNILGNEVYMVTKFNKIYCSKHNELYSLIKNGAIEWI